MKMNTEISGLKRQASRPVATPRGHVRCKSQKAADESPISKQIRAVVNGALESILQAAAPSASQRAAWGVFADMFTQMAERVLGVEATTSDYEIYQRAVMAMEDHFVQIDNAIEKLNQQLAALNTAAQELRAAQKASSANSTSYAAAVKSAPVTRQPQQHTPVPEPYKTFRVTSHGDTQLPNTTQEALKFAQKVLDDITAEGCTIRAADVSVQRNQHGRQGEPQAVIVSVLPSDAICVKASLWDRQVQERLHGAGLSVRTYLPQHEFKAKQALWRRFEGQMRAWVDEGKPLIYSNRHQSVTVEGGHMLHLHQ